MIEDLHQRFEREPFDAFVQVFHQRVQHLGVCLVDGVVIERAEADALGVRLLDLVRGRLLGALADRPGDALRLLDVLRRAGYPQLEDARGGCEAARARLHPPPAPPPWREIAELNALSVRFPELCALGAPCSHVEFAARLGVELPADLLALYAAFAHLELGCRHVDATALKICAGDALALRDGRVILFERVRRHPRLMFVEQPGMSVAMALGVWWLVLEDERAPATRRPLDLQGLLRFALLRMEAPSRDVLLTDLAWRRFFS
ncbi:MAG TPA: hypothetical protein VGC42_30855 [Kofleriaceae bacterium]